MPPKKAATAPKKADAPKKTAPKKTTKTVTSAGLSQKKAASSSKNTKDVEDKLAKLSTADAPKPMIIDIELKDLATVLKDEDGKIKDSGKWPMIVDGAGRAAVFLRYQGGNCLDTLSPADMQPESIRKRLIGSIRYGNNFTLDFGDLDKFSTCKDQFNLINKNLMDDVLDKSIFQKYEYLITDDDGPEYEKDKFLPHVTCNFQFIVLSKIDPAQEIRNKFYIIRIKE